MNRTLTTYLILLTVLAYSQDTIGLKNDTINPKKNSETSDNLSIVTPKVPDTITLDFDKNELTLPLKQDGLTRVIMVKEKSKLDRLKYLLPIISLFLGIGIKELLEKRSNIKKTKKAGERWVAELRSLEEPIKTQIKSLKEFLEEHEKEDFKIPRLQIYSSLNGEIFKSMDKNELIKYIELNNSKKEFKEIVKISNRTNGYISILVHLYETLREKFEKFLKGISTHTTSLSLSLQSFNSAFREYGVELERELNSDPYNDPRYKPIADLYSAQIIPYLQGGNFNPFVLEKKFFIPLVEILAELRLDGRTKELVSAMTSGRNAIKGIQLEKQYMTENIKTILKHYEEQMVDLENIVKEIENTKHNKKYSAFGR